MPRRGYPGRAEREDKEGKRKGVDKRSTSNNGSQNEAPHVPALPPSETALNPAPVSTATLPQAGQFITNPAMFQQYGVPATALPFQAGYNLQPLVFPQVVNHHRSSAPMMVPYAQLPEPNYHYLQPYESFQPPFYPARSWQPTAVPYTAPQPTISATQSRPDSLRRHQSPSPAIESEDLSGYPELSKWLRGVDKDHLRSCWGHQFSQFSARFELAGLMSLLHLEQMTLDGLIGMTSIEEVAAQRLLRFVRVRATLPLTLLVS